MQKVNLCGRNLTGRDCLMNNQLFLPSPSANATTTISAIYVYFRCLFVRNIFGFSTVHSKPYVALRRPRMPEVIKNWGFFLMLLYPGTLQQQLFVFIGSFDDFDGNKLQIGSFVLLQQIRMTRVTFSIRSWFGTFVRFR